MKKYFVLVGILLINCLAIGQNYSYRSGNCKSQSDYCPKISVFHETDYNFHNLGINSINADIKLSCNRGTMSSLRVGINYLTFPKISGLGIPVEYDYLIGRGVWMFEVGGGINYLYVYKNRYAGSTNPNPKESWLAIMARIGVRYDKINGLFFKAGYNPQFSLLNTSIDEMKNYRMFHMLSVGIGYTFNHH